ncbi:ribokinase [Deinococcus sp. Arct2-2]|uniref:ribokinase n=1 Tax=Deinococcus sp. Arct2-2 TaxID=2568653 RepID=UPI0010A48CD0|nr:ribokinase [Deinococcus sp. Arct2-2]THF66753.1 ribokinase [Deinococcus sp. Arct2-2]
MITVVGSVNMDLSAVVSAFPRPGETVLAQGLRMGLGGKGANQAVTAARLGAQVTLYASVGCDVFGLMARKQLRNEPLSLKLQDSESPTGMALIGVTPAGENSIMVVPGANADLQPGHFDSVQLQPAGVVLVQLEIPQETWRATLHLARQAGVRAVVNASPLSSDVRLADFVDADVLVVNQHEAAALLNQPPFHGIAQAQMAARRLAEQIPEVVVTLGALGAVWAGRAGEGHAAAPVIQAVDTTGAGDAFCGALCAALEAGLPLGQAVAWGNAAGALTATKPGTVAALPTRSELLAFTRQVSLPVKDFA